MGSAQNSRGLSPGTDKLSSTSGICWLPKRKDFEATRVESNNGVIDIENFITGRKKALKPLDGLRYANSSRKQREGNVIKTMIWIP